MGEGERHLRPRDGSPQPTSPVELLFDLVYVIAVTQLAHLVISRHISLAAVAQASFLLLVVWWAWIYTTWMVNWFDPSSSAVRLVLVLCSLASLLMSAALPRAFGETALLFAGTYVALQVGRNLAGALMLDRRHGLRATFERITVWSLASGVLWMAGASVRPGSRMAFWGPALAVDLVAPALGYWVPRRGRARTNDWAIEGHHFAERFQAFIIIALGESIGVTGLTAASRGLHGETGLALAVAFLETGALWWLYFGEVAEHSQRDLARAEDPGRLARDAYTYLHLPIVAGIIMVAVADASLIAAPDRVSTGPVVAMLICGPVVYLGGESLFRLRMIGTVSLLRVAAMLAIGALAALGGAVSTLALVLTVTGVLTGLALGEYPPLTRRLRHNAPTLVTEERT